MKIKRMKAYMVLYFTNKSVCNDFLHIPMRFLRTVLVRMFLYVKGSILKGNPNMFILKMTHI